MINKAKRKQNYFEGWYVKQQNEEETIAFIPAIHNKNEKEADASLQIIDGTQSFSIPFDANTFFLDRKRLFLRLGDCEFSPRGCELNIKEDAYDISGKLIFSALQKPIYDIMGPFAFIPFMECRHSVFSMIHQVDGTLTINGKKISFENAMGYMEGDRGNSFPTSYIWTHCNWNGNSIMMSVATIPYGIVNFTGCIGFIFFEGKSYRIATYNGVKIDHISGELMILRQQDLLLIIKLIHENNLELQAPKHGQMHRRIKESIACTVRYTLMRGKEMLFDHISDQASYENNW